MKSATLTLELENKWYAPRPHAFKMRDEYSRRMTHAFALMVVAVFSFLIMYMVQTIYQTPEEIQPNKYKEVVVPIVDVTPPPPPVEKNEALRSAESLPNFTPATSEMIDNATVVDQVRSRAIMQRVETLVASELTSAIAEIEGGLPKPSSAAVGDGSSLLSAQGRAGLRTGGNSSGLSTSNLGGGSLGFDVGPNAGVGRESRTNFSLEQNGSLSSLSSGKKMALKIDMSFKNMKVSGEGRKSEEIEAVVRSLTPALEDVYRAARGQQAEIKGLVVAEIFIQPDGTVRNARILKSAIRNSILENGMMQVLRRTKFGAIKGEIIQRVEIPYNFSAEE